VKTVCIRASAIQVLPPTRWHRTRKGWRTLWLWIRGRSGPPWRKYLTGRKVSGTFEVTNVDAENVRRALNK